MNSQNDIPEEVQGLLDEALQIVQTHPNHELGQNERRIIYETLRSIPRGEVACRWLAILAAQRVLPIYEHALTTINEYQENDEFGVNAVQKPRYMLHAVEQVMLGLIARESVKEAWDDFYHFLHIGLDKRVPYLALSATYEAVCEAMGTIPLHNQVSKAVHLDKGTTEYVSSDKWTDEELAGAGANAADAAVNAVYAYAQIAGTRQFDYQKVLEFWRWWLEEAIPQAWKKAGETQRAG